MIVVTGLMRSGTSPLARMLHQMGVPMGTFQRFPFPGGLPDFEWEDSDLSEPLLRHFCDMNRLPIKGFLRDYISTRQHDYAATQCRMEGIAPMWGVKSPLLLPFVGEWREIAADLGEEVIVILTNRAQYDTYASMRRACSRFLRAAEVYGFCKKLQDVLVEKRAGLEDYHEFLIYDTWAHPRKVADRLAGLVGIKPDLYRVTLGIGKGEV